MAFDSYSVLEQDSWFIWVFQCFFDDFFELIYFHFLVNSNNGFTNKADSAFIIAPKLGKYFV